MQFAAHPLSSFAGDLLTGDRIASGSALIGRFTGYVVESVTPAPDDHVAVRFQGIGYQAVLPRKEALSVYPAFDLED